MSHPYAAHRQTAKEHSRVKHITKGYASGGAVNRTEDDSKVRKMSASQEREVNPEGGVAPHRADRPKRAKGGKVGKHKGNAKTVVNVITGGHPPGVVPPIPGPPAGIAPAAMAPPPMVAKPPMMSPPGAGGPPPGGPPMPMRAKGGRVHRNDGGGTHVPGDTVETKNARAMNKYGERASIPIQSIPNGPSRADFIAGARAKGGAVKSIGMKVGTPVSHITGKSDLPDMNRKRVVTFMAGGKVKKRADGGEVFPKPPNQNLRNAAARGRPVDYMGKTLSQGDPQGPLVSVHRAKGGRVESPDGVAKATKLPGGGGGGEARLAKAHRAERR